MSGLYIKYALCGGLDGCCLLVFECGTEFSENCFYPEKYRVQKFIQFDFFFCKFTIRIFAISAHHHQPNLQKSCKNRENSHKIAKTSISTSPGPKSRKYRCQHRIKIAIISIICTKSENININLSSLDGF